MTEKQPQETADEYVALTEPKARCTKEGAPIVEERTRGVFAVDLRRDVWRVLLTVGVVWLIFFLDLQGRSFSGHVYRDVVPLIDPASELHSQLEDVRRSVATLKQRVTALSESSQPLTPDATALQLGSLQSTIEDTSRRIQKIEQVILADPAKALEMNMLRHDLQNLQIVQQANQDAQGLVNALQHGMLFLILSAFAGPAVERLFKRNRSRGGLST